MYNKIWSKKVLRKKVKNDVVRVKLQQLPSTIQISPYPNPKWVDPSQVHTVAKPFNNFLNFYNYYKTNLIFQSLKLILTSWFGLLSDELLYSNVKKEGSRKNSSEVQN